jgi:phage nucleotide-binding protein
MITGASPVKDLIPFVKMGLYGPAGHGKTKLASEAPKPIWFDYENSTETLRHWPEYVDIPVKCPKKPEELFADVQKVLMEKERETIVLDSVTSSLSTYLIQRMVMVKEKGDEYGRKRDEFMVQEGDYKYATQVFNKMFMLLQQAPINVVIIAHDREYYNESTGKLEAIRPDITPRLRASFTRLVNVVGYLQMERSEARGTSQRKLYLNPTNIIEAKNRLNIQETFILNPTWKELFNA